MKKKTRYIRCAKSKQAVIDLIAGLDTEKTLVVTVERHVKKRTLSQNSMLHKWVDIIAEEIGDTSVSVKADLKAMLARQVESKVSPGKFRPQDTSEMNTKEMTEFLDRIYVWANEFGIRLPVPEEMGMRAA